MRKWKSVTQMSESKKKSSPPLRHTSLAIDVCVNLHSSVILLDPVLYIACYTYSPHIIRGFHTGLLRFALLI